ncbi:MAG: porin [Minwuia sp.]|uniref:porin n=1 Tax=Minwuia sp. TaxID=2493630 RepID=UPI003A858F4B
MNHKHLLAGVAAAAVMAAGNAYAAAHASVEDQIKANSAAIDALSKEVEALKAGGGEIQKGVKGVNLKISGHVNRAVALFSDANGATDITYVDNDASSTRVRWDADTTTSGGLTIGTRLEMEMESNSSVAVNGQAANNNAGGDAFAARHAYVFIKGGFGTLTTGQQGEATEGILHNSFNFASLADINPEHTNGSAIVGGGFLVFGDGGRQDSIRYDTPQFGGFQAAVSARDNGEVTVAGRYSGKVAGLGVLAGVGYEENFGNQIVSASAGINFGVIALNGAMAVQMNEGAGVEDDAAWYVGLAHRGNYSDMGATSLGVDFSNNNGQRNNGINNSSIGIGIVQGMAPGADAYASLRHFFGGDAQDGAQAAMVGMRVTF